MSFAERFYANDLDVTAQLSAISECLQHDAASLADAAPDASAAGSASAAAAGAGWLRELPTATDGLKHKLQDARTQIRELPDIGRTVAEQEAEIRALEQRLAKQRAVLQQLREAGARFAEGEQGQPSDRMVTDM